jgi:hypothetical protein
VLQVPAPDASQIPPADILGVTIVLLTCSYKSAEFVRVGYYVNNEHPDYAPAPEPQAEAEDADVQGEVDGDPDADDDEDDEMDAEGKSDALNIAGSSSAATAIPTTVEPVTAPPAPTQPIMSTRDISRVTRTIAALEPRVTKFPHKFGTCAISIRVQSSYEQD